MRICYDARGNRIADAERDAKVIHLWNVEKLTMTQIGQRLGCSKGAIAQVISRLRSRNVDIADRGGRKGARSRPKPPRPAKEPKESREQREAREMAEAAERQRTIALLASGKGGFCSFPMWPHGAKPNHIYCCKPRRDLMAPYCLEHMRLAYRAADESPKRHVDKAA